MTHHPATPELLAPAGNLETALAAFDAGADAVYCGLGRFNARERAGNFSFDDLHRLIDFARSAGRRVYVTFNTLVFESELRDAAAALAELRRIGPDALIVQDPGVMVMIRRFFPELALHFSTQAGIHNSAGVRAAARFGASRVILERQLTLDEIRRIAARSPVELEVFIHGSLCCSLSGRCMLSEALHGGSGNRGRCKQPCRMRYGGGYPLSPADLNGVEVLPELRRIGVASLKIEGRLRPPEYVWKTARAYRMLLDAAPEEYPAALAEAEKLLGSAAGRGSSTGFFFAENLRRLIDPGRRGSFGIPAARVERRTPRGVEVTALGRMHLGDRLRPLSPDGREEGDSFSLVSLEVGGKARLLAAPGARCLIPDVREAKPGWILHKIGENGFDFSRRAAALPAGRFAVDFGVELAADGWRGTLDSLPGETWRFPASPAPARSRALDAAAVAAVFRTGAPEPRRAGKVRVAVIPGVFLPVSELKTARRAFWEWAAPRLAALPPDDRVPPEFDAAAEGAAETLPGGVPPFPEPEYTVPAFLPEAEVAAEAERIRAAYRRGVRCFRVTGWHALELLAGLPGLRTVLAFPFFVANSFAAQAAEGTAGLEAVPELPADELELLRRHTALPVRPGEPVPLLVTRLALPEPGGGFRLRRSGGVTELHFAGETAPPDPASGSAAGAAKASRGG